MYDLHKRYNKFGKSILDNTRDIKHIMENFIEMNIAINNKHCVFISKYHATFIHVSEANLEIKEVDRFRISTDPYKTERHYISLRSNNISTFFSIFCVDSFTNGFYKISGTGVYTTLNLKKNLYHHYKSLTNKAAKKKYTKNLIHYVQSDDYKDTVSRYHNCENVSNLDIGF